MDETVVVLKLTQDQDPDAAAEALQLQEHIEGVVRTPSVAGKGAKTREITMYEFIIGHKLHSSKSAASVMDSIEKCEFSSKVMEKQSFSSVVELNPQKSPEPEKYTKMCYGMSWVNLQLAHSVTLKDQDGRRNNI